MKWTGFSQCIYFFSNTFHIIRNFTFQFFLIQRVVALFIHIQPLAQFISIKYLFPIGQFVSDTDPCQFIQLLLLFFYLFTVLCILRHNINACFFRRKMGCSSLYCLNNSFFQFIRFQPGTINFIYNDKLIRFKFYISILRIHLCFFLHTRHIFQFIIKLFFIKSNIFIDGDGMFAKITADPQHRFLLLQQFFYFPAAHILIINL